MKGKHETFGPRSCPLIRSTWMSDAQWEDAKTEFSQVTGYKPKAARPAHACPQCGTDKGPFGAASGMCMRCSDRTVEALLSELERPVRRRR